MKTLYATAAIAGTLVPWVFFGGFFANHGVNVPLFLQSLFANGPASGFSADVLISIAVFWIWAYGDAKEEKINTWWLIFPAGLCVGLSLALPLYLYLREANRHARQS
ncbi:MAG: DUF2834 domain-containing protein [Rhodobacteraceae bacterium]|nr:DUF2834 domain-containing protein [Paracoccaceae bacterium]